MNGLFKTDTGQVRDHNEDAGGLFLNESGQLLAVIADGMGGHQAGDVASQLAATLLQDKWENTHLFTMPGDAEQWLKTAIKEVNDKIMAHAKEHEECKGMGTTVVAVVCTNEFISIAHIGDSRCYIVNESGFKQVTEDHSLVNELVRSGQISKEEAEHHPRKNVLLQALGIESNIHIDIRSLGWEQGNILLLCTDGLTNKLTDKELTAYIAEQEKIEYTAQQLIDLANERGGEDNISLLIIHHSQANEEVGL